MNLFEMNEYSTCVQIFDDDRQVEGIIKYSSDEILVIRSTDMFTLSEYQGLSSELKNGNTALRNRNSREEYLASVTEIRSFRQGNKEYYFVGICGSGMKASVQNSSPVMCIEQHGTGSGDFSRMLPLMNVAFVRNGQLTVVPFVFKYLRENIHAT